MSIDKRIGSPRVSEGVSQVDSPRIGVTEATFPVMFPELKILITEETRRNDWKGDLVFLSIARKLFATVLLSTPHVSVSRCRSRRLLVVQPTSRNINNQPGTILFSRFFFCPSFLANQCWGYITRDSIMTDAGFFRGTSAEQDNRFSNKNKKLMKTMSFSEHLNLKVCCPLNVTGNHGHVNSSLLILMNRLTLPK